MPRLYVPPPRRRRGNGRTQRQMGQESAGGFQCVGLTGTSPTEERGQHSVWQVVGQQPCLEFQCSRTVRGPRTWGKTPRHWWQAPSVRCAAALRTRCGVGGIASSRERPRPDHSMGRSGESPPGESSLSPACAARTGRHVTPYFHSWPRSPAPQTKNTRTVPATRTSTGRGRPSVTRYGTPPTRGGSSTSAVQAWWTAGSAWTAFHATARGSVLFFEVQQHQTHDSSRIQGSA